MQWVSGIACRRDGSWTPPKGKAPCLRMLYWSTTSTAMSICCKHSWSADNCVSSSQCSLCWGTQQGLPKIRAADYWHTGLFQYCAPLLWKATLHLHRKAFWTLLQHPLASVTAPVWRKQTFWCWRGWVNISGRADPACPELKLWADRTHTGLGLEIIALLLGHWAGDNMHRVLFLWAHLKDLPSFLAKTESSACAGKKKKKAQTQPSWWSFVIG